MLLFGKKILLAIAGLSLALSPVFTFVKTAQAQNFMSDNGGGIISTALGCSGILNKGASALTGLLNTVTAKDVPVADAKLQNVAECLNAIAYTAAKAVLAKITRSSLEWINSGFQGSPTFVQDRGSFFTSIANEQVSDFTAKIAFDPKRFPFGRLTAQNIVKSIQGQLDYNASVSSGNLLNNDNNPNMPYEERFNNFTDDFLYGGGWDGYLAVTQITDANPFDSYIKSVNKIGTTVNSAKREASPIDNVTKELQESGGFLSLKKCIDPNDYKPESDDTTFTRAEAMAIIGSANNTSDPDTVGPVDVSPAEDAAVEWLRKHTCKRFQTQTPGTAISQQMNISLGIPQRQLELADTINESISAVFDALLKQFFSKGVASLSGSDNNQAGSNVSTLGGYGSNSSTNTIAVGSSSNTPAAADQWYNQNKNFDLITAIAPNGPGAVDPDPACNINSGNPSLYANDPECIKGGFDRQGILVVLKEYKALIEEESEALAETKRWLHELDYCVPGPRPDWEQTAVSIAQEKLAGMNAKYDAAKENESLLNTIGSFDPSGLISSFGAEQLNDDRREIGFEFVKSFTGFRARPDGDTDHDTAHDLKIPQNANNGVMQMIRSVDGTNDGYKEKIKKIYNGTNPPDELQILNILLKQEYRKISVFNSAAESINEDLDVFMTIIPRIEKIYRDVLASQQDNNINNTVTPPTAAQQIIYDRYYATQLRIFSSLVSNLKTGDDIDRAVAEISVAKDTTTAMADKDSGLVRECNANLAAIPFPQYSRRAYPAGLHASNQDYLDHGWPSPAPFRTQTNATFLPNVEISGDRDHTNANHPDWIFVWDYMWGASPLQGGNGSPTVKFNLDSTLENSLTIY